VIGPYPVAPVLARLKAQVPELRQIGHCGDLKTALSQQPLAAPAAFVVRQERARPSAGASGGVLVQLVDVDVILVLYVRNQAQAATGGAAAADMDALVASCRGALLNWSAAPGVSPLTQNASRDDSYQGGALIVQELFRSDYRIEVRP
jgi:hypothetical protein